MNVFPFALLMICLPLGTGLQSLATTICTFFLLISRRGHIKNLPQFFTSGEKLSHVLLLAVIVLPLFATLLNLKNPEDDVLSNFLGFIPLVLLPCLFVISRPVPRENFRKIELGWTVIMSLWMVAVITQHLWGWKIQGVEIVRGMSYTRSQGFYSHPLTLAYVALMLWPFHLVLLCYRPRAVGRYILVIANLSLLYYSASRTAQVVAVIATLGFTLSYFRGRTRGILIGIMALGVLGIFTTDNMISKRFLSMKTQISEEKESDYPDDRIAFWIVHWNMVKERPLLGHGINLNREYRMPYYQAIGLRGFKKAYEAHNQLLQIAAEGGLMAAAAFLAWLGSLHYNWKNGPRALKHIRDLTILCLLIGGLTQNAYFDGEVRYAIMTLFALMYAFRLNRQTSELPTHE